jgi:hypothetical protein
MYEWGRKMRKRALPAVLASALLLGIATITPAQNFNDDHLPNVAQSGIGKLAASEWNELPQSELDCVSAKLHERGDSIQSFVERGISPADPQATDVWSWSRCRPSATSTLLGQVSAQSKYAVDGVAVGSQVDSATYLEYKCSPSDQFDGFTWCQKTRNDQDRRRGSTATYSILRDKDGNVVYVNRFQAPAFFNSNEADKEIQGYSHKLGETAHLIKIPHRAGLPDGIIALWGKTTLEPLDHDSIKILAGGRSPKKGLLIDFISNFARSAKDGLPIYRIGGGPGLLWVASFDQKNRGTVRFAAVDASGLSPVVPGQAREVSVPKPKGKASATNLAALEQITTQNGNSPNSEAETTHFENISDYTPATAQLIAGKIAFNIKSHTWEVLAYGTIFGGLVCVTLVVQLRSLRRRAKGLHQLSEAAILPVQIQTHAPESSERSVSEYSAPQLTKQDYDERDIAPEQEPNVAEKLDVQQPFSLLDLSLAVHGESRRSLEMTAA